MPKLKEATLRDFGGGWNVADNDLSIKARYLVVSDNVVVESDNAIRVRFGDRLYADFHDGTEQTNTLSVTFDTTDTEAIIEVTMNSHGLATGNHVTISGATSIGGISAEAINATHGIIVLDANTFAFAVRETATSTASGAQTVTIIRDTHTLGGDIIDGRYFQDYLIVVTDIGEIGRMNSEGGKERIWSFEHADALAGSPLPWGPTRRVSFTPAKGTLLLVNGRDRDKPLEIDNTRADVVQYLADPLDGSNAEVPRGDWIIALNGYVIIGASENGDAEVTLSISAKNTTAIFAGNAIPDDAVDVDLTQVTTSIDPKITGLGFLRDKLVVTFTDSAILGILGLYEETAHEPDFSDLLAQHGCLNGRTIISLGNDVLMTDFVGVPSVTLSQLSGTVVPERVSALINPALQSNLARLSRDTTENDVFAAYDIRNKRYMLFVPKYDEVAQTLPNNPFTLDSLMAAMPAIMIYAPGHNIEQGDSIVIANAVTSGDLDAADINGTREVLYVVDGDYLVVEVGATYTSAEVDVGGIGVTITPVNDETLIYTYTSNPQIKASRWTRYRGKDLRWATISAKGRIFWGKEGKVYIAGAEEEPIYGDQVDEYDAAAWFNNQTYEAGYRILDNGIIYRANEENLAGSGYATFEDYRDANPDVWSRYRGVPISFVAETPWSDLGTRGTVKSIRYSIIDAPGRASFTYSMFHDKIYINQETLELAPAISIDFAGDQAYGFGQSMTPGFAGTRRTAEQLLWSTPIRGKLFKLRFEGEVTEPLKITAVTLHYAEGSIHR